MLFNANERIALFIDGSNLHAALSGLEFDVDYKKLLALFRQEGRLVRAYYYASFIDDVEHQSLRPLLQWLQYNGFTTVTRRSKSVVDAAGRRYIRRGISVELAVDAMQLADSVDHVVLFSGEGHLRSLVRALQEKGKRVSVVSTIKTRPPIVADELRRQADQFIELADLEPVIGRHRGGPQEGEEGLSGNGDDEACTDGLLDDDVLEGDR